MTISELTQVYGCKVSKVEFLEWCLAHPESYWFQQINDLQGIPDGGLQAYIDILKTHADIPAQFTNYEEGIFGNLEPCPFDVDSAYGNMRLGFLIPPHDQNIDNILIVGLFVDSIDVQMDLPLPLETKLPFLIGRYTMDRIAKTLEKLPLTSLLGDRKRELYLVQNDCHCCP